MSIGDRRFSRRAIVLLGLLVASLAVTVLLAWQAQRAASSHLASAQNVLREYGVLAADEFTRRIFSEVGYGGYFRVASALAADPHAMRAQLTNAGPETARAARLAQRFFAFDSATAGLTFSNGGSPEELGRLLVGAATATTSDPFGVVTYNESGLRKQAVFAPYPDGTLRGFVVDYAALAPWLASVLAKGPLLPSSLADGQVTNDVVYLRVDDPNGQTVFVASNRYDPYLRVKRTIGGDYQGVFEDFVVTASIDPDAAASLVIGGLPRSRLPLLMLLFILTVALLGTAIWLLRREHAVMRLREDFVSQASHELRTPLTHIRMFAETLLLDRARDDAERDRALRIINREATRLVQLADNLLTFSTRDNGPVLHPVEQDIAPLVRDVCDDMRSTGRAEGLQVELDESVRAPVDANALRQMLVNLLDNAVKYGPKNQIIWVTLERADRVVRLTVQDEGPGVPAAEREAVWQAFHRLERERNNGSGGAGIGLSVVRDLVEAHGGRCLFKQGPGACAVIDLPLATEPVK